MYKVEDLSCFLTICISTRIRRLYYNLGLYETIHSRSYTYIIKNLYSNPSEVFDTIISDEKIERRSKSVTEHYDELINLGMKKSLGNEVDEYDLKEKLWRTLVT